jgi:hypothetical protein
MNRIPAQKWAVDAAVNFVANAVINGAIAWLLLGQGGALEMTAMGFDLAVTAFILALIVALIAIALARRQMGGGVGEGRRWTWLPQAAWARALVLAGLAVFVFAGPAAAGLAAVQAAPMPVLDFVIFKGVFCGVVGAAVNAASQLAERCQAVRQQPGEPG